MALGLAVVAAIAGGIVVGIRLAGAPSLPRPVPSVVPSPSALSVLRPSARIPAECNGLYRKNWARALTGLSLSSPPISDAPAGSTDSALNALARGRVSLSCVWGIADVPSEASVVTTLATVGPAEASAAIARMKAAGWACSSKWGGTRCLYEKTVSGLASGESDFVRDDVWIATRWNKSGPDGYTQDIVNTLWP